MNANTIAPADLSRLIGGIYDCVLNRNRWAGVMEQICPLVGSCAASLNIHRLSQQTAELLVEHGTDSQRSSAYVTKYGRNNPLIDAALLYLQESDVRTLYGSVDISEFRQTQFYNDWVAPQGWGDWMVAMLFRSTSSLGMLAFARRDTDGPFTQENIDFLRLLLPHIQKAATLGRMFAGQQTQIAGMDSLMQRIKVAAFLTAKSGRITHANGPAMDMLAEGNVFRDQNGYLTPLKPDVRQFLRDAAFDQNSIPRTKIISHPVGKRILSVIPPSEESGGCIIVLVSSPEDDLPLPGPILMEAFGLTAAEIRVLVALVKGQTIADVAREQGVTPRTVKAHLQKLFSKTDTKRQVDLIRKVLSLVPPLRLI